MTRERPAPFRGCPPGRRTPVPRASGLPPVFVAPMLRRAGEARWAAPACHLFLPRKVIR